MAVCISYKWSNVMLRYMLPILICFPLYASESKYAKKDEKKIALKKNENIFDIKLSLLPALANMVTDLTPFVAPEQPSAILSTMSGVPEDTLITLQNVQNAITEKEPFFFTKMNYWARHNRYVTPDNWNSIVSNFLSPQKIDIPKLIECATVAARYENLGLANVILTVVADRLLQGENKNTPFIIENTDLDHALAQMIVSKALLENAACSIVKVPVQETGQYSTTANSALLCRTATKEGCCLVTNQINDFRTYVLREQSVLTAKWLYMQPFYQFIGTAIATDASSDLRYQLVIIKEKNKKNFVFLVQDTIKNGFVSDKLKADPTKDISIIFENNGYDFYLKASDNMFKSNAKKIFDTNADKGLLLQRISLNDIDDLFIKKQFEKGRGLCRCLEQKQTEKFSTRVLHTLSYTANFLDELKKVYNNTDFMIMATACNYDAFTHSLLMQNIKSMDTYYTARVSFAPDPRINPFLACMNGLPTNNGTLYAHALCVYYLCTSNWLLSAAGLTKIMGALYNTVDPSMKTLIGQKLSRSANPFSYFGSLIKQNLSFLKLPAMAAAVAGSIKLVAMSPAATLISLPLVAVLGWKFRRMSQQKHSWIGPKVKEELTNAAIAMLMIPMVYYHFTRGNGASRMNYYY